jgi:hypothetical protein
MMSFTFGSPFFYGETHRVVGTIHGIQTWLIITFPPPPPRQGPSGSSGG